MAPSHVRYCAMVAAKSSTSGEARAAPQPFNRLKGVAFQIVASLERFSSVWETGSKLSAKHTENAER